MGAHVTGVTSTKNVEVVRSLGADEVIDYTREDLTKHGPVFDVVIDAVGKYAYHWGRRVLKPGGSTSRRTSAHTSLRRSS